MLEPLVSAPCDEVRGVYDRGAQEIEAIILKYHNLIARQLTPERD